MMFAPDEMQDAHTNWPIFIVSLKDATSRRAAISQQLRDLGLNFEFVDAIDGRAGLPLKHERDIDRPGTKLHFGRPMSDGEYACALSHLTIYRRILTDHLAGAVVLEDDAIVGEGFAGFLYQRGYVHAPLVQLDHLYARVPRVGAVSVVVGDCKLVPLARNALLTTGYTISRAGAEFILERALPLRSPADWPCDLRAIGPLCAVPRLVDHPIEIADTSTLKTERDALARAHKRAADLRSKYLTQRYWKKKWLKLTTKRVS